MVSLIPKPLFVRLKEQPKGKRITDAWKHSRPNDKPQSWPTVAEIDVPVNEMEDFILELFVPIIARELIFSMRDHVAWARTSRVDDLSQWPIYQPILDNFRTELKDLAVMMNTMLHEGKDQDNFRMMLPLAYMTHFTLKISARSLVKLTQACHEMAFSEKYDQWVRFMFKDLYDDFMAVMGKTPYWKLAEESRYQRIPLISEEWQPFETADAVVLGGMLAMRVPAVPIALRAQLVRHRPLSIRDNLHTYLHGRGLVRPIASRVDIELAMPVSLAVALVKKRNCWISQDDLWRPVLDTINNALGRKDAALILPCNGCNFCPIARDNVLRHQGDDPAPPCPIWMSQNGFEWRSEGQRINAYRFAERRGHHQWWTDLVDQVN